MISKQSPLDSGCETCRSPRISLHKQPQCSYTLMEFSNSEIKTFRMFGRSIKVIGKPKAYARRLLLAEELVKSTGRKDWAVRLGMIKPDSTSASVQEEQVVL